MSAFARVLGSVWLARALLGWLLALPFVAVVNASGLGALLEGDRALFEPGGLWLAELGRVSVPALGSVATFWPYLLIALALRTLPEGALLHHVVAASSGPRASWRAASQQIRALLALGALEIAVKGLALVAAALLAGALAQAGSGEVWRRLSPWLAALLAAIVLGTTSVLADTRRALLFVRPELGAAFALTCGIVQTQAVQLAGGYLLRVGLGALGIALGARLVERLDVSRPGAWRVLLVLLVHQATLCMLTGLQALWARRVASALPAQAPESRL